MRKCKEMPGPCAIKKNCHGAPQFWSWKSDLGIEGFCYLLDLTLLDRNSMHTHRILFACFLLS